MKTRLLIKKLLKEVTSITETNNIGLLIIKVKNKYLLFKRKGGEYNGYWGFVGGHIKKGETPKKGTVREVKEEANLIYNKINFSKRYKFEDKSIFVFYVVDDELNVDDIELDLSEHTKCKLFTKSEIKELPKVMGTCLEYINDI
jgi:ADP-ribose pyrophosphatase YjhB (NUDIX family)